MGKDACYGKKIEACFVMKKKFFHEISWKKMMCYEKGSL
jgi:hypothetical protein